MSKSTKYNKALVLGLGCSGIAASRLLLKEGSQVTAVDAMDNDELAGSVAELKGLGAEVILGAAELPADRYDICITSPGISSKSNWLRGLEERGVEVLSELELGASRLNCPILAITGTNGKSTMVKLCGEAISEAGGRVELAGNYGLPLCDLYERSSNLDWAVVEVSSFQLEMVKDFSPKVGVLLNIQPDHQYRHGSMEEYERMKVRVFGMKSEENGCTGIVLDDLQERVKSFSREGVTWKTFGLSDGTDYRYEGGDVVEKGNKKRYSLRNTVFENSIMGMTAAASVAAIRACGLDPAWVERVAPTFTPLDHRMQKSGVINGVSFINDSKATNLAAMAAGLEISAGNVRLIAGGQLKEKSLESVKELLVKKAKKVYLIGEAEKLMDEAWNDVLPVCCCGTLENAVRSAWQDAQDGDTVLLSPGCASFDQFRSFEDRGRIFCSLVKNIEEDI